MSIRGSILGTRVLRTEDPGFLSTGAIYTEDVQDERLAGACYVHFVRSTVAHAKINGIDVSAALEAPGVLAVYTATTPSASSAALVSMPLIRACATVDRTKCT